MEFIGYQHAAALTAVYPPDQAIEYLLLGLTSEVGELAALHKRFIRDGQIVTDEEWKKELGDILWYVSQLATERVTLLEDIARTNIAKLADRANRGVIQGKGGER